MHLQNTGCLSQRCVMLPRAFSLFREMKARVEMEMSIDNIEWKLNTVCKWHYFAVRKWKKDLQKLVDEFSTNYEKRKLKVNVGKVMVLRKNVVIEYTDPYRVRT